MMKKKLLATLMSLALCVGLFAGCGASEEKAEVPETTEIAAEEAEEIAEAVTAATADKLLEGKKVVYIANECASDWQSISTKYLKALVETAGGECKIYDPNNDANVQADMVAQALVEQPDVIVIKPIDQAAIVPSLKNVNAAGIPIITLDTGVIAESDVDIMCAVQTDQTSLGRTAAEYVEKVASETGETAKVITILGDMSSNIALLRQSGFNDYAAGSDKIEVLAEQEGKGWSASVAYDAVLAMMSANPDANTIFCCADCMMSGVIEALDYLGKLHPAGEEGHITIVGIDCDPNGCSYMEQGYVDQESEHNAALHSDIAFKVIVDYVNGYDVPTEIFFDTTARTIDNVADAWGNMDVEAVDSWGWMDQDAYILQTPVE